MRYILLLLSVLFILIGLLCYAVFDVAADWFPIRHAPRTYFWLGGHNATVARCFHLIRVCVLFPYRIIEHPYLCYTCVNA